MCFDAYHRRYRSLPGAFGVAARTWSDGSCQDAALVRFWCSQGARAVLRGMIVRVRRYKRVSASVRARVATGFVGGVPRVFLLLLTRTVVRPLTLKDLWAISNYFDSDVSVM